MTSKKRSTKARNALGLTLIFLVLSQFGLAAAIDSWLPSFRDSVFGPKAVQLLHRLHDAKGSGNGNGKFAVVLGSSHVACALNGRQMEMELAPELGEPLLVYNFGCPGAGSITQYLNLGRLLARQVKPDLVMLEVFPPWLAGPGPVEEAYLPAERLERADLAHLEKCGFPMGNLRRVWWQAQLVPWYSHRCSILNSTSPWLLPFCKRQDWSFISDAWGWRSFGTVSADIRSLRTRFSVPRFQPYFWDYCLADSTCEALRQSLAACRLRQIPVAVILMPEGTRHLALYPAAARKQIRAFLEEVSCQFHVPVIDAREWLEDDDFVDGHHT